jgi:xanthine dehydrogenase YagS FAD-binding subunit
MHLPPFEYARADSVDHAVALLGELRQRAAVLAGGTDLLATLWQRLATPEFVIAIRGIPDLQGVAFDAEGGVTIGAATTLSTLTDHAELGRRFPMLQRAFHAVASRHVRNMATLGGNLALPTRCWYTNQTAQWREARAGCFKTDHAGCHVLAESAHCVATSSADSVPALIVHDATVTLASRRGVRTVPLADFYREDGAAPTVRAPDELIVSVHVPAPRGRMAFIKVTPREGIDFGLGTIAVAVEGTNRRVRRARIVANSLASRPLALDAAAQAITGRGLDHDSIEAAAGLARGDLGEITSLWTPAGYKRRLVRSLLRRALDEIRRQK